ncbi:MAG: preprotein translocase subunit SecG [Proteobacteria bacterium]|nr:preprotein translocase subunit SecG [Pseudomonadota bacterium]
MMSLLLTLNTLICIALIVLILLQRSDPASGGMFGGTGGGGSQPVIRNPLARPTSILAALFLIFCLIMAVIAKGGSHSTSVMTEHSATATPPAIPTAEVSPTTTIVEPSPTIISPTGQPEGN